MTTRTVASICGLLLVVGCVKEISSDERLARELQRSEPLKSASAAELKKSTCDELSGEIGKLRDSARSEEDRLNGFGDLYERLKGRSAQFEQAMALNPDLAYQEGSQELVAARDTCIQLTADAKFELESLVRDIVQLLIVDEIKGGQTIKVARLDFGPLKTAIETLKLDDREALLGRIVNAEKQVEAKPGKKTKQP